MGLYAHGVVIKKLGRPLESCICAGSVAFSFNHRTSRSRGMLFYRLLQQAVQVEPVTGRDIKGS